MNGKLLKVILELQNLAEQFITSCLSQCEKLRKFSCSILSANLPCLSKFPLKIYQLYVNI